MATGVERTLVGLDPAWDTLLSTVCSWSRVCFYLFIFGVCLQFCVCVCVCVCVHIGVHLYVYMFVEVRSQPGCGSSETAHLELGIEGHTFNLSTQEAEAGRSL